MAIKINLIILFFFSVSAVISQNNDVITIYASEFNEEIKKYDYLLVNFYSEECVHSQALNQVYNKLSQIVRKDFTNVILAKVPISGQQSLISKYDIRGTPTIILLKNSESTGVFYGEKNIREIFTWLSKKINSKVKKLNKGQEVDQYWDKYSITSILFGNNEQCPLLYEIFENISNQHDDIIFAYCDTTTCLKHFNAKICDIFLLKHIPENKVIFSQSSENLILKDWLELNKAPLIMDFNQYTSALVFSQQNPAIILFRDKEILGDKNHLLESTMIQVAKSYKVIL